METRDGIPFCRAPGVYKITNLTNGKIYVGSTAMDLYMRLRKHRIDLLAGRHYNIHLQRAWDKYGQSAFLFEVIEECDRDSCIDREQFWIDHLDVYANGYNRLPTAGSRLGMKHSEKTKEIIGAKKRGVPLSEEHKAKLKDARSHRGPFSESTRKAMRDNHWKNGPRATDIVARISASQKGRVFSEETRAAMSAAKTPEVIARIKALHTGKLVSAEARAKMSASKTPEIRAGIRDHLTGRIVSAETRAKISASKRRPTAEQRARISAAAKAREERKRKSRMDSCT